MSTVTEETITISLTEYERLLDREQWLCCLEAAGVDNWCGWDEAIDIRNEWNAEEV